MDLKAMFNIQYGLFVCSTQDQGMDNACIVNTFSQVTANPNRVMVIINKQNHTHDMIMNSQVFTCMPITVNADFSLFERFGFQSGKSVNKFTKTKATRISNQTLILNTDEINSYITANVIQSVDCETHTMFIADVEDCQVLNHVESCTYNYYQSKIKPQPQATLSKGWRCTICGYVYDKEVLPDDYICPICKHGIEVFEKI